MIIHHLLGGAGAGKTRTRSEICGRLLVRVEEHEVGILNSTADFARPWER